MLLLGTSAESDTHERHTFVVTGANRALLLKTIEYVGIVKDLRMNQEYAAALFTDGRVKLHMIDALRVDSNESDPMRSDDDEHKRESMMIDNKGKVSSIQITEELLIFASEQGIIEFFHFEDWSVVSLYRHSQGIRLIESDLMGLRVAAVDEFNKIFVYNVVTDSVIDVLMDDLPVSPHAILWDKSSVNSNLFIIYDGRDIHVHTWIKETIEGAKIEFSGSCRVSATQSPLLLHDGSVTSHTTSGNKVDFILSTHEGIHQTNDLSQVRSKILPTVLKLRRFTDAIRICNRLSDHRSWDRLARIAMYDMDLDLAIHACEKMSDFGLSVSLRKLQRNVAEKTLIMAHLAVCLEMYDLAQELFLASSQPEESLIMRQNIHDWKKALALAKRLSPQMLPLISREYASQLELSSEYETALIYYENAMDSGKRVSLDSSNIETPQLLDGSEEKHQELCIAGIARNALRIGNRRKGMTFAFKLRHHRNYLIEFANICESVNFISDAALLYESAREFGKAADLYIQDSNMAKVAQFIDYVSEPEPLIKFARFQEKDGRFKDAITAYKRAGKVDEVIRILLHELGNPDEAMRVARESKSVQGTNMIAKFFQEIPVANLQ